jgi:hypothetical protein
MGNVVIATTMWDNVTLEEGAMREEELKEDFWKKVLSAGYRTGRFKRTSESAWDIIGSVMDKNSSTTLLIQEEMTGPKKSFHETTAGRGAREVVPKPSKGLLSKLRRLFKFSW